MLPNWRHLPVSYHGRAGTIVVSGPTVVGPLLGFIRPTERLQRVLSWEGSLIDPVGGILGAVDAATQGPVEIGYRGVSGLGGHNVPSSA